MISRGFLYGFAGVATCASVWNGLVAFGALDPDLFPPLQTVAARALELAVDPTFIKGDLGSSMRRLVLAAALVLPCSITLGLLAGYLPALNAFFAPLIQFTFPLPKVAIFPLILATFGIGDGGKIVLIGIGIFYPLFINVADGMRKLRAGDYEDLVHVYNLRGLRLFVKVYLRGVTLNMITGLKGSLGYGFTLVVVSELTASNNGIGNFIWRSWDSYRVVDMYAGVFWLCLVSWIVQILLDFLLARHLRFSTAHG